MRKNFFKKLSFVLALAMIISVIAPAAGAFAASAPKLSATKKYLHLDKEGANEFDFNITHKQDGWKYLWSSANENVATVEKNGLVTATGVGSTKVSVVISEDGEEVDELTATVVVRDNIKELTSLYIQGTTPPAVDKLAVGTVYDFGRKFKTVSGSTTKTGSVTRWSVDKTTATIGDSGKFTATAAGTYVITARSFQSAAKYASWLADNTANAAYVLATKTIEVTVVATMDSVVQADIDTLKVTFSSAMVDVDKNITVSALVGTTKVKQTIKEVKMDDAKKVAEVTLYVPFTTGATYVVDYTNMTSLQFVAATTKAEDVATMQVTTTAIVAGVAADVDVKLLNAAGVDITTTELLARVTYASSSEKTYMSGKSLTIFTKGDSTTVTATFHSYKYDTTGTESGNVVAAGVVVGTDPAAVIIGAATAWTIVTGSPNFGDVKHVLAAEDAGYKLFVRLKQTVGTTNTDVDSDGVNASKFTFTSSDATILFIENSTDTLYPIKAGTVTVVVKYDDKVVDAISITVGAKRAATAFTLDAYSAALSNAAIADTKVVKLTLKDQLGADFALANSSITKLSGSPATDIATLDTTAKTVTFVGTGAVAGTYTYKITTNGLSQIVTVVVTAPVGTVNSYKLQLSSTAVDLKLTADDSSKKVTVSLFGYAGNGIKLTQEAVTGATFTVTITNPDNATTNLPASGQYDLTPVTGGVVTKAKVGTYKVTVSQTIGLVTTVKDITYFTVTDTQAAPTFTTTTLVSTQTDLLAAIKACFKFTLNGEITSSVTLGEYIGSATGSTVFVKNVKYLETIATGVAIEHTIAVNTNITKVAY